MTLTAAYGASVKVEEEINQDKNKSYERLNMVEEHDVAHDARLNELEKAGIEATQKLVLEIDEQITRKSLEDHEYLEALKYQMDKTNQAQGIIKNK